MPASRREATQSRKQTEQELSDMKSQGRELSAQGKSFASEDEFEDAQSPMALSFEVLDCLGLDHDFTAQK